MGSCNNKDSNKPSIIKLSSFLIKEKNKDSKKFLSVMPIQSIETSSQRFSNFEDFEVFGAFPIDPEKPFAEKKLLFADLRCRRNFLASKISVTCRKGLKENENQDNFFILSKPPLLIVGVCDGHGKHGHVISSLIQKILSKNLQNRNLMQNPMRNIGKVFEKSNKKLCKIFEKNNNDCSYSGCTVTLGVFFFHFLYICHLGDSQAILGKNCKNKLLAVPITNEHTPEDPVENERIKKSGGLISKSSENQCLRVFIPNSKSPGLSVTRAIGDKAYAKVGVSCKPIVREFLLEDKHKFLVICTDGVWKVISHFEVVEIIEKNSIDQACDIIATLAWNRWTENLGRADDITVLIVPL